MANDKSKRDKRDRLRVAGGQDYEVMYIAKESGATPDQVRQLIKAYGNSRDTVMAAAMALGRKRKAVPDAPDLDKL